MNTGATFIILANSLVRLEVDFCSTWTEWQLQSIFQGFSALVKSLFHYVWRGHIIKEQSSEGGWAAVFSEEVPVNLQEGNSNQEVGT